MKKWFQFLLLSFLFLSLFVSPSYGQAEITTRLENYLSNVSEDYYVPVLVVLRDQVDIQAMDAQMYQDKVSLKERAYKVITSLQEKARSTQPSLVSYLRTKDQEKKVFNFQSFWIVNMIKVDAKPEVIKELMNRMDVVAIDLDAELSWDRPVPASGDAPTVDGNVADGLKIINADKLWKLGITGAGRLVMGMDTGVDGTHPALSYKWRGTHVPASQAWLDLDQGSPTPTDGDQHGTHTMGTMCGRQSSTGDTIGVAIDAEWIAAKTIMGSDNTSQNIQAFQWAMNPDNNASTIDDMPDAIGNSWYDPNTTNECSGIYKTTLDALEAAGIAVVFSAGNSGPNASTITKPKNISTDEVNVFAVGAIDGAQYLAGSTTPVASFSSRGPSVCGGTGSLLIKPEISAPGVAVRSSIPGGTYAGGSTWSGTSMACPHVVGAIALLKQFAPTLTGKQIKMALYNTAKDLGTPGEDNNYGMGLLDVYAAFLSLGTPDSIAPTAITNLNVSNPTSNSLDINWTTPADSSTGGIAQYEIRYSTSPINDANFSSATNIPFNGAPGAAGSPASKKVEGLSFGTKYYFAIKSKDVWSNTSPISNIAEGTTYGAPVCATDCDSLSVVLKPAQTCIDTIIVSNISAYNSTLDYSVSLKNNQYPNTLVDLKLIPLANQQKELSGTKENPFSESGESIFGQGGPDLFGYEWIDSDAPNGPAFVWNDIATTGTLINNWVATSTYSALDEGKAGPFQLGFNFKYYGQTFNQIWLNSNGFISIADITAASNFTNPTIPKTAAPNGFIAALWDDLDGSKNNGSGKAYYKQDGDKFIIQFTDWALYSTSSPGVFTFQIVLYSSGKIMLYYKSVSGTVNSSTVGIENPDGTDGLQVAYNAAYLKSNLAIKFAAEPDWLGIPSAQGRLYNGNSVAVQLTFRTEDFPLGNYKMDFEVASNDPAHPAMIVPVRMKIDPVPVELTSFSAVQKNHEVILSWATATEKNNAGFRIEKKNSDNTWQEIASLSGKGSTTEVNRYMYTDKVTTFGKYAYRLKQVDFDGTVNYSKAVEVNIVSPDKFELSQNYPNPFNPATVISYSVPEKADVMIRIYSITGELIRTLVNKNVEAGYYTEEFNASSLPSGTYLYQMTAKSANSTYTQSKKMLLMK